MQQSYADRYNVTNSLSQENKHEIQQQQCLPCCG